MKNLYKNWPPYKLGIIQSRASRNIIEFRETILSKHGLSSPEWFVLGHAASQTSSGGVKVGSVAELLDVHSTYVTGLLRKLESKGLVRVKPDKQDRRVRLITVTKKGASTAKSIDSDFVKQSNEWLSAIPADAMQQYISTLQAMARDAKTDIDIQANRPDLDI